MKNKYFFVAFLLYYPFYVWSSNLIDVNLKINAKENTQYLTFSFNQNVRYKISQLSKPNRIVIEIPNAVLKASLKHVALQNTAIKSIRLGSVKGANLQLIIDLKFVVTYHSKTFQNRKKFLLQLTLHPSKTIKRKSNIPISKINNPKTENSRNKVPEAKKTQISKKQTVRQFRVLIDAGHGGKDPGAIGYNNTYEKDVVLKIALILKQFINDTPGMKAILTRDKDCFVPLRERLLHARKADSDLFISIHADAYKNSRNKGSSVYVLSERGASSEAARWLAEKENYSELGGIDLSDKSQLLRSVLIDLSQTATIGSSLRLGEIVLDELKKVTSVHIPTVELAPFVVLKSPDIPSLLIETGFISNRIEETKLKNPKHQMKLAQAIFKGILKYSKEYPVEEVGQIDSKKQYTVKRGDNLQKIAKQYNLPLQSIMKINKLAQNRISPGQIINIPD